MLAAPVRRLPGFRFEAQNAPLDEALPRMDVALFVGFAASGAIDVASASTLTVGDLVRLTFSRKGHVAFGSIAGLAAEGGGLTRVTLDPCTWFTAPDATPGGDGVASFTAADGAQIQRTALIGG